MALVLACVVVELHDGLGLLPLSLRLVLGRLALDVGLLLLEVEPPDPVARRHSLRYGPRTTYTPSVSGWRCDVLISIGIPRGSEFS